MPKKKYYAVVLGRKPDVYESWAECEKEVDGFSGALFKSFPTLIQANEWITVKKAKISGSDPRLPIEIDLDSNLSSDDRKQQKPTLLSPESPLNPSDLAVRVSIDTGEHDPTCVAETRPKPATPLVDNPYKRKRNIHLSYAASSQASCRPSAKQLPEQAIHTSALEFERKLAGAKTESFIATILKVPVSDYVKCAESGWEIEKLWRHLCQKQSAPVLTKPIQSQYTDPNAHFRVRKSLVLEEVREAIARPLIERWSHKKRPPTMLSTSEDFERQQKEQIPLFLNVREVGKSDTDGTRLLTLHRPFEQDSDGNPNWFTAEEKEQLMTGCVFECVNLLDFSLENAVLVVVLPCSPKRIHKLMEFDVKVATEFSARMMPGPEFQCTLIENVISYERQFHALCRNPRNLAFLSPLLLGSSTQFDLTLGDQSVSSGTDTAIEGTVVDNTNFVSDDDEEDDLSRVYLPCLNRTQELAMLSFINSPKGSISIVQGPPGTGKTTTLLSTIVRFLLPAAATEARGRVLVCAPTNKAVSVLALRFWEAISTTRIRLILVGDDSKLLEESGGNNSPLNPFHVYSWKNKIEEVLQKICNFCSSLDRPKTTSTEIWKLSVIVSKRILASLLDVPESFKNKLKTLCAGLKTCTDGMYPRSQYTTLARGVAKEFADFPADHVRTQILNSAHVIFTTLCSAASSPMAKMTQSVDALIVDEAAAATEPSLYIPFCHGPSKLLVVGDPKQLPAIVISKKAQTLGLDVSLHDRLMFKCGHRYTMLDVQYRMNPEISCFPSTLFYNGKVKDGDNLRCPSRQGSALLLNRKPYVFLQVPGMECQNAAGSSYNLQEADAVVSLVEDICKVRGLEWCTSSDRLRIITFYRGQVALLKKKLAQKNLQKVLVGTVDASQGCEADVVLISFVRSGFSPGFLTDDRRMNVSLTRAKHQLVCIGNVNKFPSMKGAGTLHRLASDATRRNVIVETITR